MRWYLAARRLGTVLVAVAVITILTVAWAGVPLPVPHLGGGVTLGVPAALLLPAGTAVAVVAAFAGAGAHVEGAAARRLPALDRALCCVLVAAAAGVLLVVAVVWHQPLLAAGGRNLAGFVGIGLIARPLLGPRAAPAAPVAAALLVGVFGQATDPSVWFWPLRAAGDVFAGAAAGATALLGAAWGLGHLATVRPGTGW